VTDGPPRPRRAALPPAAARATLPRPWLRPRARRAVPARPAGRAGDRLRRAGRDRDRRRGRAGELTAPAPSATAAAAIWPVSPTPTGLDRDTAVRPALPSPSLRRTDQDGRPFDLASLRGEPCSSSSVHPCRTSVQRTWPTSAMLQARGRSRGRRLRDRRSRPDDAAAMKQYVGYYGPDSSASPARTTRDGRGGRLGRLVRQVESGSAPATPWPTPPTLPVDGRAGCATGSGSGLARRSSPPASTASRTRSSRRRRPPRRRHRPPFRRRRPHLPPSCRRRPRRPPCSERPHRRRRQAPVVGRAGRSEPHRGDGQRPGQPGAGEAGCAGALSLPPIDDRPGPVEVPGMSSGGPRRQGGPYVAEMTLPARGHTRPRSPSRVPRPIGSAASR